jgi:hypothetical protein
MQPYCCDSCMICSLHIRYHTTSNHNTDIGVIEIVYDVLKRPNIGLRIFNRC